MKLRRFNSPRQAFCTCLPKYNLNTYTGRCAFQCIYCYSVKFPSFIGPTRPRLSLFNIIEKMARNTKPKLPVMISDCTEPYQPLEKKYQITRTCIEALAKNEFPLLVVTKSSLVTRDLDLFKKTPTVVAMTVTTIDEEQARIIEPFATPPYERIAALSELADEGITTAARIDPIIPTFNDDKKMLEELVHKLVEAGIKHITTSTLKPVRGFFRELKTINPELSRRLSLLYADSKNIMGYRYLPTNIAFKIIEKVRRIVLKYNVTFASCREKLNRLNTSFCDGSEYCRRQKTIAKSF